MTVRLSREWSDTTINRMVRHALTEVECGATLRYVLAGMLSAYEGYILDELDRQQALDTARLDSGESDTLLDSSDELDGAIIFAW